MLPRGSNPFVMLVDMVERCLEWGGGQRKFHELMSRWHESRHTQIWKCIFLWHNVGVNTRNFFIVRSSPPICLLQKYFLPLYSACQHIRIFLHNSFILIVCCFSTFGCCRLLRSYVVAQPLCRVHQVGLGEEVRGFHRQTIAGLSLSVLPPARSFTNFGILISQMRCVSFFTCGSGLLAVAKLQKRKAEWTAWFRQCEMEYSETEHVVDAAEIQFRLFLPLFISGGSVRKVLFSAVRGRPPAAGHGARRRRSQTDTFLHILFAADFSLGRGETKQV